MVRFGKNVSYDHTCSIARHVEDSVYTPGGKALILDQLLCTSPGKGHMTRILRRYLRRLPPSITEVWTVAHPYRCGDGLHWKEIIRYARWLRRLGFRFQDRAAFFSRLREHVSRGEEEIWYGAIRDAAWMVLTREGSQYR